jgi:hypothetical protein
VAVANVRLDDCLHQFVHEAMALCRFHTHEIHRLSRMDIGRLFAG